MISKITNGYRILMKPSKLKVLVLGGNGFIGKNLVARFKELNFDVDFPRSNVLDLLDRDACRKFFDNKYFDLVVHCAVSVSSVENSIKMFVNVADFDEHFDRMICIGSGAEYNPDSYVPQMSEDFFGRSIPSNGYPLAKFLIGACVEHDAFKKVYNLRVCGIYGPHEDHTRRFISNNICRILSGKHISINKDMKFDYIHVDDLFNAINEFSKLKSPKFKSYNVTSGEPRLLSDIANLIADNFQSDIKVEIKNSGYNPEYSACNKRFLAEVGGLQFLPIREGVEQMVNFYTGQFKISDDYRV